MVGLSGGARTRKLDAYPLAMDPYSTPIPQYYGGRKNAKLKNFGNSLLSGLKKTGKAVATPVKNITKSALKEGVPILSRAAAEALAEALGDPSMADFFEKATAPAQDALKGQIDRGVDAGVDRLVGSGLSGGRKNAKAKNFGNALLSGLKKTGKAVAPVVKDVAKTGLKMTIPVVATGASLALATALGNPELAPFIASASIPVQRALAKEVDRGVDSGFKKIGAGRRAKLEGSGLLDDIMKRYNNHKNAQDYMPNSTASKIIEYQAIARNGVNEVGHHDYFDQQNKKGKIQFGKGTKGGKRNHIPEYMMGGGIEKSWLASPADPNQKFDFIKGMAKPKNPYGYTPDPSKAGFVKGMTRGGGRGANPWVAHVKEFASEHGLSYKQALSHPSCSSSYKK